MRFPKHDFHNARTVGPQWSQLPSRFFFAPPVLGFLGVIGAQMAVSQIEPEEL